MTTSNQHSTISFPLAFSISPVITTNILTSAADGNARNLFSIYARSSTSFTVYGNSGMLQGFTWIAIGY